MAEASRPNLSKRALALYQKHFGFVGFPYPGTKAEQARVTIMKIKGETAADPQARRTYLGTPIFMPLTLDGWDVPLEPLIEIGVGKSIVRTPLAGYNGTVKENMGLDDYAITIRGVLVNEDTDEYPEADVLRLRRVFEKKNSVEAISPLLGLFNITRIALENWRLPGEEGVLSYQPYELTGYSDFDVELLLRDDLETLAPRNVLVQR